MSTASTQPSVATLRERTMHELAERRELMPEVENILREFITGVCPIPRKSGDEQLMADHIAEIATNAGFTVEPDNTGNLLFRVPATDGYEHLPGIVFQGHMDMVCVKGKNALTDPSTEGVVPALDASGEWLTAVDSTLGADNGIAIPIMLALAETKTPHGEMAFLFTTEEETSMNGAKALTYDLSRYQYFVNLDWEDENEAAVSSACGGDTTLTLKIEKEDLDPTMRIAEITVDGLLGGHSGVDIGEKRENAIKLMADVLRKARDRFGAKLIHLDGGDVRNAIASHAQATIAYPASMREEFKQFIEEWHVFLGRQFRHEPRIGIDARHVDAENERAEFEQSFTDAFADNALSLIAELPHGIRDMSATLENVVDTSTNLGVLRQTTDAVTLVLMSRSISEQHREEIRSVIGSIGLAHKAAVEQSNDFKGWNTSGDSNLVNLLRRAYTAAGHTLKITGTHAGLECGTISLLYPHLETVAIGPTIKDAHKTTERLNIQSVTDLFTVLTAFLEEIATEKLR